MTYGAEDIVDRRAATYREPDYSAKIASGAASQRLVGDTPQRTGVQEMLDDVERKITRLAQISDRQEGALSRLMGNLGSNERKPVPEQPNVPGAVGAWITQSRILDEFISRLEEHTRRLETFI